MAIPNQHSSRFSVNDSFCRRSVIPSCGFDFNTLAKQLDCLHNFHHAGIIFSNGVNSWVVRPSRRIATPDQSTVTHVLITRTSSITPYHASMATIKALQSPAIGTEITSTLLSCGAMVVSGLLTFGAGATTPLTGGATGVVAALLFAGTAATVGQCTIGVGRLVAIGTGHEDTVAWLDSEDWYNATATALDVISLAGAGAGLKRTVETYQLMKRASSKDAIQWLKSLSRPERKRITEEIIRARTPGISNGGIKAAIRAHTYPKRYPAETIQRSLQRELVNAITNSSAFVGSAVSGTIRHPQNITQPGQYVISVIQSFTR